MLRQFAAKRATFLMSAHPVRASSTEFKRFFGFEDKLEETKIKNDKELEFDVKKMNKLAVIVTSVCKLLCASYVCLCRCWLPDVRSYQRKTKTSRPSMTEGTSVILSTSSISRL